MHYPLTPGVNIRPRDPLAAGVLCAALAQRVSFLQHPNPALRLRKFDDWHQHDGLMFDRGPVTFHDVFGWIDRPKTLLAAMTGDHEVRVGVAPAPGEPGGPWYLRFILDWDPDETHLEGTFDLTLPPAAAPAYRREVVAALPLPFVEEDAETYFREIVGE